MSTPIPNITGGAATAGPVTTGTDVSFAPVSVGGLFGSSARASDSNEFLLPALIVGGAILAFALLRKR